MSESDRLGMAIGSNALKRASFINGTAREETIYLLECIAYEMLLVDNSTASKGPHFGFKFSRIFLLSYAMFWQQTN